MTLTAPQLAALLHTFAEMNAGQRSAVLRALGYCAGIPPGKLEAEEVERICKTIMQNEKAA